jgi:hypothetical protein
MAEQDFSANPLTVPPQCKRNQLTLFVSSLCGATPDVQASWREQAWCVQPSIALPLFFFLSAPL